MIHIMSNAVIYDLGPPRWLCKVDCPIKMCDESPQAFPQDVASSLGVWYLVPAFLFVPINQKQFLAFLVQGSFEF